MAARQALDYLSSLGLCEVSGAAAFAAVCWIGYLVYHSHTAGLDHIPGPWLAKYTNLHAWIETQRNWGTKGCYLRKLHDKYGDIVRVAPRRVSVADPDAIPVIYGMKAALDKSELIRATQPLGKGPDNLFSVRDSKTHGQMRRTVASAYAVSTIVQYEPRIDDTLDELFGILRKEDRETNIGRWVHYYVYDVAGNMTYAQPLGYLDSGRDAVGLIYQTKLLHRYMTLTMPMPIIHDVASFVARNIKAKHLTVFHRLSQRKVKERLRQIESGQSEKPQTTQKADILDHFLAARDKYSEMMTDDQIITHCMVNVVAGVNTSTHSIVNVFGYLLANPDEQDRLYKELVDAGVSYPASWQQSQNLPFLESLVREGVRLRGGDGPNPNGRVVNKNGMVLPGDVHLPPGTIVGVKPSVASIQDRTFGAHPYEFNPHRWLQREDESDEAFAERRAKMDRGDMSFSAGTRGCIGRGIAMMQVYKLLASLFIQYKLLPPSVPGPKENFSDFMAVLQPREKA